LYGIPALELIAVFLLGVSFFIKNRVRYAGLYLSQILMLVFTGYIILIKLNFYKYIPCSCGGAFKNLNWTQHLALNLFFVAIGAWGIILMHSISLKESKMDISAVSTQSLL
jgi:hypothetical protein